MKVLLSAILVLSSVQIAAACPPERIVQRQRIVNRPVRVQREKVVVREQYVAPQRIQRERIILRQSTCPNCY